jgi:hypothetical protein
VVEGQVKKPQIAWFSSDFRGNSLKTTDGVVRGVPDIVIERCTKNCTGR